MQTGQIVTFKTVDGAKLYSPDGTEITGLLGTISSVGMGNALKQITWNDVPTGTYFLSLLQGSDEIHFGIEVVFTTTTWAKVNDLEQVKEDILDEGGTGPWGDTTVTTIETPEVPENMLDTLNLAGPKSIKTKDLEVTAHGLNGVAELHKSLRAPIPISLNTISFTKAEPKEGGCDC